MTVTRRKFVLAATAAAMARGRADPPQAAAGGAFPLYYLEKIGCFCWGFVAGKYQTYEPWEGLWKQEEKGKADNLDFTRWQHDLIRPSLRPYDPKEIKLIKRFNKLADEEAH